MTTSFAEGKYPNDWLLEEYSDIYNCEAMFIEADPSATAGLESGTVLQYGTNPYQADLVPCTTGSDAVAILKVSITQAQYQAGVTALVVNNGFGCVVYDGLLTIASNQLADAEVALGAIGFKFVSDAAGVTWATI
jgi:hypothetical protein